MRRAGRILLGVTLLWGALGVLGYRLGWQMHSHRAGSTLLRYEPNPIHGSASGCSAEPATPNADGVLAGVLAIPRLGVTAPVESGTSDDVLSVAVGHYDSTSWPGQQGTSVLLAHDVSYLGQVARLQPGDRMYYQSGCVNDTYTVLGHQVVKDGAPIPPLSGAALVLDTCWPTDALWFTPDRYLVEAVQSQISVGSSPVAAAAPTQFPTNFVSTASPSLQATGLSLTDNEEPMGTMTIAGSPSTEWSQSPAPLALEAAALAGYFGGYHAATGNDTTWWQSVAPGVTMPLPLSGSRPELSYASPLDVTIKAAGDQPTAVLLHTVLPLSGGRAPGTYAIDVTEAVHGGSVFITNWEVNHD